MGFSHWSDSAYNQRQQQRRRTNQSAFTYDRHVRESGRVEVHPQMDPFGRVRESRASDAHPDAVAIAMNAVTDPTFRPMARSGRDRGAMGGAVCDI